MNEDILSQVKQKNEEEEIGTEQEETSIEEDIKKIRDILNTVVKDPSPSQKQIAHKLDLVIQELMENLSQTGYQKYLNKLRYRSEAPHSTTQIHDEDDITPIEEIDDEKINVDESKPNPIKNNNGIDDIKDYGSLNKWKKIFFFFYFEMISTSTMK